MYCNDIAMEVFNVCLTLLVIFVYLIYWYIHKSFSYWKRLGVPHNKPIIPYGNVKGLGKEFTFNDFMGRYYDQFKGSTKLCGAYFFTRKITMLLDLDLIKTILVKDFSAFSDRNIYYNEKDDPLSAHLVALDGKKWKDTRLKLTPTFTSGKMKNMFSTISEVGNRLTDFLHQTIKENDELEIKGILDRFTMDVIGTCAFGVECNTLKDTNNDFYRIGRMAMKSPRHNPLLLIFLTEMKGLARFLRIKSIRDEVSTFFINIVKSTIAYREENNIQRNDFMDLLIKMKTNDNGSDPSSGLTINQIAAQSFLFFSAGYETSSMTMLFTLYELALNQDLQTKLRHDIENAFKKHGELTYEMMMDIPYLDQTINGKKYFQNVFLLNIFFVLLFFPNFRIYFSKYRNTEKISTIYNVRTCC